MSNSNSGTDKHIFMCKACTPRTNTNTTVVPQPANHTTGLPPATTTGAPPWGLGVRSPLMYYKRDLVAVGFIELKMCKCFCRGLRVLEFMCRQG